MPSILEGAVPVPKSIFSRRNYDGPPRQSIAEQLVNQQGQAYQLCKWKTSPAFLPEVVEARKLSRSCRTCFPSHEAQIDDEIKQLGITNVLDMAVLDLKNPISSSVKHHWDKAELSYKEVPKLDRNEVVKEAAQFLEGKDKEFDKTEFDKAGRNVIIPFSSIWHGLSVFRLTGWILRKIFSSMFKAICVHEGAVELLKIAHQTGLPIVYVPVYRSDLDHFVIFYTLQSLGLRTPYFFSTRSQRYWGKFVGGIGFSQFAKEQCEESRQIRNAFTCATFRCIIKKQGSFTLNLESHRSRNGMASTELFGIELMNELNNCWHNTDVEDACIVPVSLSYDRLPDHFDQVPFTKCSSGYSVLSKIRNYLSQKFQFGLVRVSFIQPFTLRELHAATTNVNLNAKFRDTVLGASRSIEHYSKTYLGSELSWDSNLPGALSSSLSSLYDLNAEDEWNDEEKWAFVDALSFHSLSSSAMASVPMSTHLVAFILLKKFRKHGVEIKQLFKEVEDLKKWLSLYEKDIGFSGSAESIVLHALEVLGPDFVELNKSDNGMVIVKPILTPDALLFLGYCANCFMSIVSMEAVVALSVLALVGRSLTTSMDFDSELITLRGDVLSSEVLKIYNTFVNELFLHLTCKTFRGALRQTLCLMYDRDLIQPLGDQSSRGRLFGDDDPDPDYDDEEAPTFRGFDFVPQQYRVNNSQTAVYTLQFLGSLLAPYLRIYASLLLELGRLVDSSPDKCILDSELFIKLLEKLKESFSIEDYGEFLTFATIKTAIAAFETNGIISYNFDKSTRRGKIYLDVNFQSQKQLEAVVNGILKFVP